MVLGKLAQEAGYELPLNVLKSNAGYYVGTKTLEGEPISRESMEYFKSHEEAEKALKQGNWTQRDQP